MQSQQDADRILRIGAAPERIRVMGNIKFDQTFRGLTPGETEELQKTFGLQGPQPVLIGGSTHSGEEEILVGLFKDLIREDPECMLILAPRHLNRLPEVEKLLANAGIPWVKRTSLPLNGAATGENPRIILLDTMGELMKMYSLGTLVFVGGSLVPIGGHNPLEPLFFKKCVLFGPYMFNFAEISRKLIEAEGAIQVENSEELASRIKSLLHDERERCERGERGYQFLQKHRGATERIFEEILPYLGR